MSVMIIGKDEPNINTEMDKRIEQLKETESNNKNEKRNKNMGSKNNTKKKQRERDQQIIEIIECLKLLK